MEQIYLTKLQDASANLGAVKDQIAMKVSRRTFLQRAVGAAAIPAIPLNAFAEHWDPLRHDEVIVSTLPGQSSKWVRGDLPHAVARYTGVSVMHVVAQDPDPGTQVPPASPVDVLLALPSPGERYVMPDLVVGVRVTVPVVTGANSNLQPLANQSVSYVFTNTSTTSADCPPI